MASLVPEPTYTVFIRLPFPRGDFVDPPPVNWEPSKDEALWSIVSKLSKTEIDWNEIAAKFEVTVDFLLQQVAWLTERHASQVRAQMRKAAAAAKVSPAPSPQPQSLEGGFSADPPRYVGSTGQPRAPSSTSIRRDSPLPRNEQNTPSSSMRSTPRPVPTRNSSTNTASYTTRNLGGGTKGSSKSGTDLQRRLTSLPITTNVDDQDDKEYQETDPNSPGPAESSSATSSSSSSPAQSRIIRRPPRCQGNEGPSFAGDDDDEDEDPAFLPYRPQNSGATSGQSDLGATLRGDTRDSGKRTVKGSGRDHIHHSQTSDSSASSAPVSRSTHGRRINGPLSPRRTLELAGRSPGGKAKTYSRDSDGTPSMGSSFSDLDDASVTQSALEEALASRMQDGGTISSLRGTLSNAFRSRYQGKPSNNP
ncbi:hypothetical protein F5B22DRAFT_593336 [Xylaria bambusicola]|uniref:uncharacterized protein n=1 Tax=Xylaria bambusicola TaxID=326684 RepID=UPI002007A9B9|nr:uncharacterized protein F5B22DRAFT_593336 [Xylaria bambusicola]KAI0522217.1 hypothetical protein F5B22DRAFT_593336 [Xylaria bambusicola]